MARGTTRHGPGDATQRPPAARRPLSVRRRMSEERSGLAAAIDTTGQVLAKPWFLFALLLAHLLWIVCNSAALPGLPKWDPYPFTLLATLASIEGPVVSLMILMRQHRDSRIEEVREELSLDLILRLNRQLVTSVELLDSVRQQLHLERGVRDRDMATAVERADAGALLKQLRQELREAEGSED